MDHSAGEEVKEIRSAMPAWHWYKCGSEDIPFVQTWAQALKKRGILTLIWIAGAVVVAGILTDCDQEMVENCIHLFVEENLAETEGEENM